MSKISKKPKGLFSKIWREAKRALRRNKTRRYYFRPVSLAFPAFTPVNLSSEEILKELKALNGFAFCPNHGNMGDAVIAMATYQFFETNGLKCELLQEHSAPENLVYGGGGRFISDYKEHYQEQLKVFQKTCLKKIIILPSSFNDCPDLLEIMDERFTVFCREEKSYNYLLSSGVKAKVILAHDMAFFITDDFQKNVALPLCHEFRRPWRKIMESASRLSQQDGFSVAYFLRTDTEASADWGKIDIQPTLDLSLVVISDSRDPNEVSYFSKLFFAGIDMADVVITDRLHVGIGATLLGKEVFLFDNHYGKISGVYKRSMQQCPHAHFVDDVQKLPDILARAIDEGRVKRTASLKNLEKIGEVLP